MDDRYPDFWAESNWPRRPRRDPFRVRLLALLVAGAMLTPIALLMRRNDGDVVTTGRLPGAAVALEPVLGGTGPTTTPPPPLLPSPETVAAGTLPPAVGATDASSGASPAAAASGGAPGAGTLPPTLGTLPVTVAPPATVAQQSARGSGTGSSSGGSYTGTGGDSSGGSGGDSNSGSNGEAPPAARSASPTPSPAPKPTAAPRPAPTAPPAPKATPAPAPPPVQYTAEQVEALIRQVFPDDQEEKALAVAWRESRHDPRAYNGWCCYGLFQIYFEVNAKFLATLGITSAEQLYDPVLNTTAALAMFQRSGWRPWGG